MVDDVELQNWVIRSLGKNRLNDKALAKFAESARFSSPRPNSVQKVNYFKNQRLKNNYK